MIKYHYNLLEDIKRQWYCWEERKWIKDQGVVYFYPNPWRTIKILLNLPKPSYQSNENIECYWATGGTWGGYQEPNKIFICPTHEDIESVIKHEITHLKCDKDVQGMTHEDKEAYVISHQS